MKKILSITATAFCLCGGIFSHVNAQTTPASASDKLVTQPVPDRTVTYSVSATGESKPLFWGLDTAWPSEDNIRRGVAFMGAERVDVVRASFQPTMPLVNGDLQTDQVDWLNLRLGLIDLVGPHAKVALNCDHPSVDSWYSGNAANWAALMDVTTRRVQEAGREVISISPFNEPDYGWGQGSITDFYNICGELRSNSRFDNIRISGGNTLNNDQALTWYNTLKDRLDEGNTHQLAGGFDAFATFYQTVRANGHYATGDELHNVMEPMVGVEYGMQTGIWWGTAELARGEFVKASDGQRLGYAEHRPNWTAASVYRNPDGKVKAFGGTSERQALTTTYRFLSKDRDVYYEGYGPQREYTLVMPGGTGYMQGQSNAERVVNITWGDDIQPAINGRYVLVNRNSGKVLEVAGGSLSAGANLQQGTNTGATYQQWNVTPVSATVGGDFSYFTFTAQHSGKSPDVLNYSLNNGASIIVWNDVKSGNQQWYLEYVEDGWFYIRSRHSAKCLDVYEGSTTDGAQIIQWDVTGNASQQWRFLPVSAPVEFTAPAAPTNVVATAQAESVRLDWTTSPESDVTGYSIFRSTSEGGPYETIARNVTATSFVDNTPTTGGQFFYVIRAVDKSLNRSVYSSEVSASPTGEQGLVAHFQFEGNILDSSLNLNHSASYASPSFGTAKVGSKAIVLNGNTFLQLPANVANQEEMTIATWVYWNGGDEWQRIFDFGNTESEYMFLSPGSASDQLHFGIKGSGVAEQSLTASGLSKFKWSHVAVTFGASDIKIYVNGLIVAESNTITIRPMNFQPVLNYIGRSQFAQDPFFMGNIDDFRIYNYVLPPDEIAKLAGLVKEVTTGSEKECCETGLSFWPAPVNDVLHIDYRSADTKDSLMSLHDLNGKEVLSRQLAHENEEVALDVSHLPSGLYICKIKAESGTVVKKVVIRH